MIRLKNIISEITLDTARPYATWFSWRPADLGGYETSFRADGQTIHIALLGADSEFTMEFRVPATRGNAAGTYHHDNSAAQLDYFRLMNTMSEAILDFVDQYQPAAIDVTGADPDPSRAAQKTRIYAALLRSNSARLAQAGYQVQHAGADSLRIVRDAVTDASGIDTPGDPNM